MEIVIRAHNMPGRNFRNACVPIHNVHVGVQVRSEPVGLVRADAECAEWHVDVRVETVDGRFDFKGPAVHGSRGQRFLYLTWGDVNSAGGFAMFRRAKLMLDQIEPELIADALAGSRPLLATIDLTDGYGGPRCGRVGSPALTWAV
ncbi:MAG TPA: DUF5990 family protein [Ilumatobacteraceae bacterium]|nr:DUF5990 family protein [Ilumatobacteraceae bacterium]